MRIDLHCHSKYSGDNHLEPEEVIEQDIELTLDGGVFSRALCDDALVAFGKN